MSVDMATGNANKSTGLNTIDGRTQSRSPIAKQQRLNATVTCFKLAQRQWQRPSDERRSNIKTLSKQQQRAKLNVPCLQQQNTTVAVCVCEREFWGRLGIQVREIYAIYTPTTGGWVGVCVCMRSSLIKYNLSFNALMRLVFGGIRNIFSFISIGFGSIASCVVLPSSSSSSI